MTACLTIPKVPEIESASGAARLGATRPCATQPLPPEGNLRCTGAWHVSSAAEALLQLGVWDGALGEAEGAVIGHLPSGLLDQGEAGASERAANADPGDAERAQGGSVEHRLDQPGHDVHRRAERAGQ